MNWVLLSLASAALFALVNHLDKYLISRFFRASTVGSLIIFSSLIGIPVFLFILITNPGVLEINPNYAYLIILNGMIYLCSLIPYFYALERDETSTVTPLFQMTSVASYIIGLLFFNEVLSLRYNIGILMILLGTFGIVINLNNFKIKKDVFALMLITSILTAVNGTIFKYVSINESFIKTLFWEYIGFSIFGFFLLLFVRQYKKQFLNVLRKNNFAILSINGLNELIAVGGKICLHLATLLSSVTLVFFVAEGFQPFFVLLFGIIITLFFPSLGKENIAKKHLIQKIVSILIMSIGTYLLQ